MEALMDFSVAIMLEQQKIQKEKQNNVTQMGKKDKSKLFEYYRNAGQAHYELAQLDEALTHFNMAIELGNKGEDYFNRGLTYMKLRDYENAKNSLNNALKKFNSQDEKSRSGTSYKVYYNLGIVYRHLGKLDESIKAFEQAISIPGGAKPAAYNNSGLSNFQKNAFKQAVIDFGKAIEMSEGKVAVHYNNRGLALYHMQEDQLALQDFERALERNPNDPNVLFNRGNVYLHLSKFDEARQDFEQAISIEPTNAKYYHAKGLAFEAQAIYIENTLLANPSEAALDDQGYPIPEEIKSPNLETLSHADQQQLFSNAPNQEMSRIKLEIFPLVLRAIKCYSKALSRDENFMESRFHTALMH